MHNSSHRLLHQIISCVLVLAILLSSFSRSLAAPTAGTIFFTVDYLIQGEDLADGQRCSSASYRLKIVMEGVGIPNQQGELPGVTIVADVEVDPGPGAWWTKTPAGSHSYPAVVKLVTMPTPDGKTMTYPTLVQPVPATQDFIWERRCIQEDGTVEDATVDLDPAHFINTFYLFVLNAGGMKEIEPGEYLSQFHFFLNENGLRRIDQRVWWGDRRLPTLTVEPDVEGVFLSGIPATVDVTYDPRWADDVNTSGSVWVKLGPGQWIKRSQPAPQPFIEPIALGQTPPTNQPIEGWAQLDVNNSRSTHQRQPFTVAPAPTFVQASEIDAAKNGPQKSITYKLEVNMPRTPFEKKWTAGPWFPPPLRGKEAAVKAQFKLVDEYESTATPATHINKLGFEGELEVGRISGKLALEGSAQLDYGATGLRFLNGQGKADLQVGVKETVGPFDLVPTLKPIAAAVSLDTWLQQYAKVEAAIFLFGAGDITITEGAAGLDWQAENGQLGVRPNIKFQLGKDDSVARLELETKGEGRAKFKLNVPGDLFQGFEGEISFTGALTVLQCKWSKEVKYTLSGASSVNVAGVIDDLLGVCGHDPNSPPPPPERWLAQEATLAVQSAGVATTPMSVTLVSQVVADASPAVDASGETLCWVQQRAAAPTASNTEIVCARGGLSNFTQPLAVTNDTYADASPSVAMAAPDTPIVAWWRHDDPNRPLTTTLDAAFLGHGEIMVSSFDGNSQQWRSPVALGQAGVLDYAPVAAGSGNGGALVAWRSNAANQLGGFSDTPDTVRVARYNPATASWGNVETLQTTAGLHTMTAAYGPTEAALLYAIDQDNNPATPNDSELYAQRLVNGAWQPVVRLTNNSVADSDPKLAYRSDGTPVIVWLQQDSTGRTFLAYQEGWTGVVTVAPMDGPAAPTQLASLALNNAGDAVVVWRNHYDDGAGTVQGDLTFALRAAGAWSTPLRLTNDAAYERTMTAVWDGDGSFATFYQTIASTGDNLIQQLHQPINSADAGVSISDIRLNPVNPAPGALVTATVTVRNLGMWPQRNVTVRVNETNAVDAVQTRPISSQTIPLLHGGAAISLSIPYLAGQSATQLTVALSCGGACGGAENDQATVAVNHADLALTNAGVVQGAFGPRVRAYVRNRGSISASTVAMTVTAALPQGERLLGTTLLPVNGETGLQPGAQTVGELALPTDLVADSPITLTVTVAPAFGQSDLTLQDNHKTLLWSQQPDLALMANFVTLTPKDGKTTVAATVFNQGYLPTAPSSVTFYSADPDAGGTAIGTATVAALEPYRQQDVTLELPGTLERLWLRVNAGRTFVEQSYANNDAFVGVPDTTIAPILNHRVLLPLVRR